MMSHLSTVPSRPASPPRSLVPGALVPTGASAWVPPVPHVSPAHPSARPWLSVVADPERSVPTARATGEDGSLVAEYGLLAVVAATVAGVLISWAGSGALASFFGQLLNHARSLVVS